MKKEREKLVVLFVDDDRMAHVKAQSLFDFYHVKGLTLFTVEEAKAQLTEREYANKVDHVFVDYILPVPKCHELLRFIAGMPQQMKPHVTVVSQYPIYTLRKELEEEGLAYDSITCKDELPEKFLVFFHEFSK